MAFCQYSKLSISYFKENSAIVNKALYQGFSQNLLLTVMFLHISITEVEDTCYISPVTVRLTD